MNNKVLLAIISAFAIGFGINNFAVSNGISKIAVVDVPAVVSKSAQVKALKKEQATKTAEIQNWLKVATADVEKQKTKEGKEKLIKKYNEEYSKKQLAITKNYEQKLIAIDKSISATIAQQAKASGYDVVLAKGVVLYGGDDLTEAIAKVVK
ncbi:MAG: OmpH family outer membrane protein [bacterium]|nr:OmpH family outer membrane protein [bacterium]